MAIMARIEPGELIACHECDLLIRSPRLPEAGGDAMCPRCGAALCRTRRNSLESALALASAAAVLLLLANCFPVVGLEIQGQLTQATVFDAAAQLWRDGAPLVAAVVVLTTIFVPAIELAAVFWLVLPLWRGRRPPAFAAVFRALQLAQPWAMVEVFILGVLVSLVKLAHFADVLPGVAIWCFGALMLVLTGLAATLDRHTLWQAWEQAQ